MNGSARGSPIAKVDEIIRKIKEHRIVSDPQSDPQRLPGCGEALERHLAEPEGEMAWPAMRIAADLPTGAGETCASGASRDMSADDHGLKLFSSRVAR